MSRFVDEILSDTSHSAQCAVCGCPGRWIDTAGRPHCEICDPWPSPYLILRREILTGDCWRPAPYWADSQEAAEPFGSDGREDRAHDAGSLPGAYDPFSGRTPPSGTWHPVGDLITNLAEGHA